MKMKKSVKLVLSLLAVMLLIVLAACGGSTEEENGTETTEQQSEAKNAINIGVTHAPTNINPLQPEGLVSTYVANLLFLPLVDITSDLDFAPMLAESITTEDNQTFTIKLFEDAVWTDGNPVTADDVIFTLELMTNIEVASNFAYMFAIIDGVDENGYLPEGEETISGVKKVDDQTLEITLKAPTTLQIFQDTIGRNLMTLPKAALEDIAPADINKSDFMQKPDVTNGPFKIADIDRNHYVEMVPNEDYFKGVSQLEQLNFKVIDSSQVAPQLKSGEIDMNIPSAGVIPVSDYELVQGLDNVETTFGEPIATQYLYINENVIPDAKQRQAISHALNRELIVENLLKGAGEVTDGFFTSISPYVNENVQPAAFDLEKAKQLLAETNWDQNQTLSLAVLSGDSTLEQAANIIGENLREVGINVEIQMMDLGTLIEWIVSMEYDLAILTVSLTPINPLPDIAYFLGEGNPNAYENARVNDLLGELSVESDEAKIKELYGELQEILAEDVPMPAIYTRTDLGAVNKRVSGATPSDFGMFVNVHEWTVE